MLIDVKRIPAFRGLAAPVASFTAWLYLATGIRAGAHSVGMQQKGPLNQLVRLAIPVGLKAADVTRLGDLLTDAFADIVNIPDLAAGQSIGDINVRLTLDRMLSPQRVAQADEARSITTAQVQAAAQASGDIHVSETVQQGGSVKQGIQSGEASMDAPTAMDDIDIAIIGMAARLPKARNAEELWDNLLQGRDCIDEIPQSRYERRRNRDALGRYRGGFIDDVDKFDSLFFNISPREAETLDPQERLFLEVAWETLEDAGYYPEAFQREEMGARRIGVYVGAVWAMYQMVGAEERLVGNKVLANSFLWSVANRASYFLNFTGPSLAVDTACSASLTAIHLACDAIRRGECAAALVGGVNLDVHQCKQEITVAGGLLSDDGLCRAFGRDAGGYVPGEGVGALLLKPLAQARHDRDNIYAVIKGSAISHGGRNSGYAVPNSKAQCDVVTAALKNANVDARSIGYIEAHGTGTELGDPIEIAGLNQAFEKDDVALQSCAIGSIKTNIGHLEAAAGIARRVQDHPADAPPHAGAVAAFDAAQRVHRFRAVAVRGAAGARAVAAEKHRRRDPAAARGYQFLRRRRFKCPCDSGSRGNAGRGYNSGTRSADLPAVRAQRGATAPGRDAAEILCREAPQRCVRAQPRRYCLYPAARPQILRSPGCHRGRQLRAADRQAAVLPVRHAR